MAKAMTEEVLIGKFDILAPYTYAKPCSTMSLNFAAITSTNATTLTASSAALFPISLKASVR